MNSISKEFIDQSIHRIEENTPRISKCLDELTEEEIWMRPNAVSNSVGILLLHLCGNIRQYAISALSDQPDTRHRDEEFSTDGGYSKKVLLEKLAYTVQEAIDVIKNVDDARLLKIHSVQGFQYSGIGIIIHVTEHYSYHTGQIAFWTKQLKNRDLGFYAGIDLTIKNNS